MIINDLFSHKIHSSGDNWPQKLIDIATVFAKFDGLEYNRDDIENAFRDISPRVSLVSKDILANERDLSKYRDEISAYPAYLGLFRLENVGSKWILKLSETAKRFLIVEEPNVPAFLLLQLSLFQYPNGSGIQIKGNNAWVVHNARDKTLQIINQGIHLSPLRFICKCLLADSELNGIDSLHPIITIDELSLLCNNDNLNQGVGVSVAEIAENLNHIRVNNIKSLKGFERRLHILNHTDFIEVINGNVHLRETFSPNDSQRQINLLNLIGNLDIQFNGFDKIQTEEELNKAVQAGIWGKYFDAVTQLSSESVKAIVGEYENINQIDSEDESIYDNSKIIFKYPLKERDEDIGEITAGDYFVKKISDPEVTRIKRQKSNLTHKIITALLDEHLRHLGANPKENEHIDMFAELPDSSTYLFEIKSVVAENLLSQTRKGISQLYEYRYRYLDEVGEKTKLCLVYPNEPNEIEWLQDYLCSDRDIAVLWFNENQLFVSKHCANKVNNLFR